MVSEVVTDRIPVPNVRCVPKTITRRIPYPVCETVTETCYRPVTRMVPVRPGGPSPTPHRPRPPRPRPALRPSLAGSAMRILIEAPPRKIAR